MKSFPHLSNPWSFHQNKPTYFPASFNICCLLCTKSACPGQALLGSKSFASFLVCCTLWFVQPRVWGSFVEVSLLLWAPVCRHNKSDVSGPSTEWSTALALGGAHKGWLLLFSLANLSKTEFKAFALAVPVWGQCRLTGDGCAASQRDWKNGKTGRKWENLMREHRLWKS